MNYAGNLRRFLGERAQAFAERRSLPHFLSLGSSPAVIFMRTEDGRRHGNFIDASFEQILANDEWAKRLTKTHTHLKRSFPIEHQEGVAELDSSNSSDALLMNVLCYPRILEGEVGRLLAINPEEPLIFGHKARVPYHSGADNTQIDLSAGNLIVEAKLTEGSFTSAPIARIQRYREIDDVFDVDELPRTRGGDIDGYQLIRNILAAHHLQRRFRVIHDDRRPDLTEHIYSVLKAVRDRGLQADCGAVTWQELAKVAPAPLQSFLDEKYGIV